MNFETGYLGSRERAELLEDYILHEVRKIDTRYYARAEIKIKDRTSDRHAEVFKKFKDEVCENIDSAKEVLSTYSLAHKWMLFHAFSYGVLYKKLFTCVGWNELSWQKLSLPCTTLQFESKTNFLHEIEGPRPVFSDVLKYARAKYARSGDDGFLQNQNREYANAGEMTRLHDPIICRKNGEHFLIHDGTGRMLTFCTLIVLKQMDPNTKITAWVGDDKKPTMKDRRIYAAACNQLFTLRKNAQMIPEADKKKFRLYHRAGRLINRTKLRLGLPANV